jgi:hypothetical protein
MLERDRVPRATVPAVSSRRWIWRIERRGFSRLAARIAVWIGGGEFRLAAIGPYLGDQSVEAASAVAVVPPLDRLLAQQAAIGAGNGVVSGGQLAEDSLQLSPFQPSPADQRTQDGEAKQGLRIDFVHDDSS